jgi:hypothetical protein
LRTDPNVEKNKLARNGNVVAATHFSMVVVLVYISNRLQTALKMS